MAQPWEAPDDFGEHERSAVTILDIGSVDDRVGEAISLRVLNLPNQGLLGRGSDWGASLSRPYHAAARRRPRREASDPRNGPRKVQQHLNLNDPNQRRL